MYSRMAILSFACLAMAAVPAGARTWVVELDGSGDVPTIQAAVEASAEGDTIEVGPGRYSWTNQGGGNYHGLLRLYERLPDGKVIRSREGPAATILDAEGQGRVVFANGDNIAGDPVDFVFEGFTITGGVAPPAQNRGDREGGGMAGHLIHPVVRDCVFVGNEGEYGGGIWAGGVSQWVIEGCRFEDNRAVYHGGGMAILNSSKRILLRDCEFVGNRSGATSAGTIVYHAWVEMERVEFRDNVADGRGPAVLLNNNHPSRFSSVVVRDNTGSGGGAIHLEAGARLELDHALIVDNDGVSALYSSQSQLAARCSNLWGNESGDWVGNVAPMAGVDGNTRLHPRLCASTGREVCADSPLLGHDPACHGPPGGVLAGCDDCVPDAGGREPGALAARLFPNPWTGGSLGVEAELPRHSELRLYVHDLRGRLVRRVFAGWHGPGTARVAWDGRDRGNRDVPSGVYLVELRAGGERLRQRVVRID